MNKTVILTLMGFAVMLPSVVAFLFISSIQESAEDSFSESLLSVCKVVTTKTYDPCESTKNVFALSGLLGGFTSFFGITSLFSEGSGRYGGYRV